MLKVIVRNCPDKGDSFVEIYSLHDGSEIAKSKKKCQNVPKWI